MNRPRVLLLDEPLGALDLKLREQMQDELKALQRKVGITFVFVTHDQGEALSMADRVAVFNDGRIQQVGTPEEVYARPADPVRGGLRGLAERAAAGAGGAVRRRAGWASLRPEALRLAAAGGRAVAGLVPATRYLGGAAPGVGRRRWTEPRSRCVAPGGTAIPEPATRVGPGLATPIA